MCQPEYGPEAGGCFAAIFPSQSDLSQERWQIWRGRVPLRWGRRRLASHWWSVLSRRGQRQRVRVQASAEPDEGACHQGDPDDGIAVDLMLHDLRAAMVTLSGLARRKARQIEKVSRFTYSERALAALSTLLPRTSATLMATTTQRTRLAGPALPHRPGQSRLRGFSTQPLNLRWDAGGAAR